MFVELTEPSGKKFLINTKDIHKVRPAKDGGSKLLVVVDKYVENIKVEEPYEYVRTQLFNWEGKMQNGNG